MCYYLWLNAFVTPLILADLFIMATLPFLLGIRWPLGLEYLAEEL